jgi:hypothetical protein
MEPAGRPYLLIFKQLPQREFLICTPAKDEKHALHRQVVRSHALVILRARQGVNVSAEPDEVVDINGLGYEPLDGARLSKCRERE